MNSSEKDLLVSWIQNEKKKKGKIRKESSYNSRIINDECFNFPGLTYRKKKEKKEMIKINKTRSASNKFFLSFIYF